ncbi:MAG: TM0106 family RecB-like putative nuclease [Chloroflexota bacterium]
MQLAHDGTLIVSATDLVGYLACDHLATLELGRVEGLWEKPIRQDDPTIALIQEKGDLHEAAYLAALRADGLRVVEIETGDLRTPDQLRAARKLTLDAMRDGADVIFQATFFDGRWRGHADFLFKRLDRPSPALGSWSYDIGDTKLARSVKAGAILQMCVYADLLADLQGITPEWLYVITGDGVRHAHRNDDFSAYFRYVRARFDARIVDGLANGPAATYPNPVDHCRVCSWYPMCMDRRRADDHLSIVAGMRRIDTERLTDAAIPTLAALAVLAPERAIEGIGRPQLTRIREQARMQLMERVTGERAFELITPEAADTGRGLRALPEPSQWDLFFDIEADPWATEVGLEYLFGVVEDVDGAPRYLDIWATSQEKEQAAFERFIHLVVDRLDAHPEMHVYHYGGYEAGAIKRLMQRHATCVDEVDRLLRGDVLVDLLNVVRQGVRASVERYSLKDIEKFYMPAREGPVTNAGFSVVEFERWLKEGDQAILDGIALYNRDDCVSTWMLRSWLEERRREAVERWPDLGWDRPVVAAPEPSVALTDWLQKVEERVQALTAGLAADDRSTEADGRRLLADLLDWHRREEKSQWWRWFELKDDLTIEQLVTDREALAGLSFVDEFDGVGVMHHRRYRFEPQDHGFRVGEAATDKATGKSAGTIVRLDDAGGIVELKRSRNSDWPHPSALIPNAPIDSLAQKGAMLRVADAVIAHGIDGGGAYRAIRDLLLRIPPRRAIGWGKPLVEPGEDVLAAARRLALELEDGVLPIQGPPGTGKTYAGAHMVLDLVRRGRKTVAITAQSHKVISNLLEAVMEAASEEDGIAIRAIQKAGEDDEHVGHLDGVTRIGDNQGVAAALAAGTVDVVAGTPWLLARPEFDAAFDVLFVDEASQMSLANAVAVGTCARSIVIIGDPNQLPMVSQGVHPVGAAATSLGQLIGDSVTVDPARGLFLDASRRLHPDVNAFISPAFYDDRLTTHPDTAMRVVDGQDPLLSGSGVRWLPTHHDGNGPRSSEEAEVVADAVARLITMTRQDKDGSHRPITIEDVIVIAPYNAQVAEIQAALERRIGRRGNVGTVDKFQGREGVVAIYSMASSSREDAPRDMTFLYSRQRLNVAISRAEAIAILVCSPTLLEAGCRTPEQMRLVDALCRFVETAAAQDHVASL